MRVRTQREQAIQDTLPSQKRIVTGKLLSRWTRCTHRPDLHHGQLGFLAIEVQLEYSVLQGVVTHGGNKCDTTSSSRWNHDAMLKHGVFMHTAIDITTRQESTDLMWIEGG